MVRASGPLTFGEVTVNGYGYISILRAIERGRAEVWFPRRTAMAAWLARLLPPALRDPALRRQPRLEEPPPGG